MTLRLILVGLVLVLSSSTIAAVFDAGDSESAIMERLTPSPEAEAGDEPAALAPEATQPPVSAPAHRTNCDQIRGTAYTSAEERNWYHANCVR
jgi:hypothetical protein